MAVSGGSARPSGAGKKRAMQVSVVVRVRPSLPHEKLQPIALTVAKAKGKGSMITMTPPHATSGDDNTSALFHFEKCYDDATPQRLLFQREIQPAINKVLEGVNTTVFAYGATGTGKTFTMEGSKRNLGMIPRSIKRLFEVTSNQTAFAVDMSYLEIYNDRVLDLLVPKTQQTDLPIRQQTDGTIAVQGLTKTRITSLQAFEELYDRGSASRARAATELNPESSRSHSILMIQARATDPNAHEIRYGKLHLIDLAGSEDNRRTGNSGARLAESGKINMSLFVLGKVITALNSGDLQRIPFRDSKLTRLLQDSLGGCNHAVMICNVTQHAGLYQECLQTLNYAAKAKGIVNHVTVTPPAPNTTKAEVKKSPVAKTTPAAARPSKPVVSTSGTKKPVVRVTTSLSPSTDLMEKKLLMWKQKGRTVPDKRTPPVESSHTSMSTPKPSSTGLKRPSPTSTTATSIQKPTSRISIAHPPMRSTPASDPGASRAPAPVAKKPRLSMMPTPTPPFSTNPPKSRMSVCPQPVQLQRPVASPTTDKENVVSTNVPAPPPVTLMEDLSPVDLAKKLIGVAIDLEKTKRFTAAYCVFKRAYHVLPEENPKLVERLHALETECPSAPAVVPSQQMSTAVYMQLVLEMDLLDLLNRGSPHELTKLHSIGDKRADKITETRPFTQLSDLLNVPGITDKLVQKLHDHHVQWW